MWGCGDVDAEATATVVTHREFRASPVFFRAFRKKNPRPNPRLNPRPAAQFRVAAFAAPRLYALNLQPARVVAAPR